MPRLAANLTMLFGELPFLDRFGAAAAAGFEAVEFMFPYAFPIDEIRRRCDAHGLRIVLHNLPAGDWDAGDRGIACDPARVAEFRAGLVEAVAAARALGVDRLNCLVGRTPAGRDPVAVRRTLIANLREAAARLGDAGIRLLVEPVNDRDIPGFHLTRSGQTLAVLDEVGAANAFLQYDVYHMQRMEGELAATLSTHLARIGHVQVADNPGRHEPGTGEINYAFLFAHLDRIGYGGWVGCEYRPATTTAQGLGWRSALGHPAA